MVLTELDYLLTSRIGPAAAMNALDFITGQAEARRFEIPDTAPHLRSAMAVMRGYMDADGRAGVGLADAMNVALAAAFQTADMFTTDGHFRMMRPLTGQPAFRLLPDDL
jgi:predicted nucleic acid-binding protein